MFPEREHFYMECVKDIGLINCKTPTCIGKRSTPFQVVKLMQDMVKNITDF